MNSVPKRKFVSTSKVYTASDPINAEIVKDFLGSHGISAEVRNQYLWGGMGDLPANVYPTVWIHQPEHYPDARKLIADFEAGNTRLGPDWRCTDCGEVLSGQFTACWNCGGVRPEQ